MTLNDWSKKEGCAQVNVDIPISTWKSAKEQGIKFKHAMLFGLQFFLAEKDLTDFPKNSLLDKISRLQEIIAQHGETDVQK